MHIEDEQLHPANNKTFWGESYYFNFMQTDGNWGGALRIGFSPNDGGGKLGIKDGFLIFYFPDGKHGFIRTYEMFPPETLENQDLSVGKLKLDCVEPYQQWRLRYNGPVNVFDNPEDAAVFRKTMLADLPRRHVTMDLTFDCFHEPFDFHRSLKKRPISVARFLQKLSPVYLLNHLPILPIKIKAVPNMVNAQHYEQGGFVTGTIKIDEEVFPFDGTGQRDHSWGVRDMRVLNNWQWFSCQFGDELAFNAMRVEVAVVSSYGGHAYYKGKCHAISDWHIDAEFDPTNKWATAFTLTIELDNGETLTVDAECQEGFPTTLTTRGLTAQVWESIATFTWNGKKSAGISEFMTQVYPE